MTDLQITEEIESIRETVIMEYAILRGEISTKNLQDLLISINEEIEEEEEGVL
jgi:hypothetical protein